MKYGQKSQVRDQVFFAGGIALDDGVKHSAAEWDDNPLLQRLPRLRAAMVRLGLVCLDREWRGQEAAYRFRCSRNHVFSRALLVISSPRSGGCRVCVAQDRDRRLFARAECAGVTCLESAWLGIDAMHRFRCPQGHEWRRKGSHVLRSANCPTCGHEKHSQRMRRKDGLLRSQQVAASHGGVCLAEVYAGGHQAYAFRCAQGHVWASVGNEVLRRTWCPECARLRKVVEYRLRDGLARLQRKAAERGGVCLADRYEGSAARYLMRCAKGHEWRATGKRLLRGTWCTLCVHDAKRLSIRDAQREAQARGGQCLSTTYVNNSTKLHWLCDRGHSWHAPLATIRARHWCPECACMSRISSRKSKARSRYVEASASVADEWLFAASQE